MMAWALAVDVKSAAMRPFLILCLYVAVLGQAHAWGRLGHRIVGQVAQAQLSEPTRQAVADLLNGEPEPSLAGIASWADELRAHDEDLGKRSSPWHYVNFPRPNPATGVDTCHYQPARDCPNGDCVVGAIENQLRVLADTKQPRLARQQALKFVVHYVGDVHQPLHAGYADDKGGNTAQIRYFEKGSNLHRVWDSGLIETHGMASEVSYVTYLNTLPASQAPLLSQQPAAWAEESCRIVAEPGLYPPSRDISDPYVAAYRPIVDQRLREAGRRLADLLNHTLGD